MTAGMARRAATESTGLVRGRVTVLKEGVALGSSKSTGGGTMEEIWHLTFKSEGRRTLYRSEEEVRSAVRALAAVAGVVTLLFCIVDDHIHLVVVCSREQAGRLAQAACLMLRRCFTIPIVGPTHFKPVVDKWHLEALVGYAVKQPPHHDLPVHPAIWTGSCFLDLVGARAVGALGKRLSVFLPRLRLSVIIRMAGLDTDVIAPAGDERIRAAGAVRLSAAAAAALAVPAGLAGKRREVVVARRAAAALAAEVGIPTTETSNALMVTSRAARRCAVPDPSQEILRTIRIRLALEDAVARAAGATVLNSWPSEGSHGEASGSPSTCRAPSHTYADR